MAYSQTLDQKRREMLRRQLYGKEVITSKKSSRSKSQTSDKKDSSTFSYSDHSSSTSELHATASYLGRDLLKVLIFSTFAIAAQLLLLFAINNHLVKLPI